MTMSDVKDRIDHHYQSALDYLNRIVLELYQRMNLPKDQRKPNIGNLLLVESAEAAELVFNEPVLFQKEFSWLTAFGPSRFNLNGEPWLDLRAKTQRYYAKAGRPVVEANYRAFYEDALLNHGPLTYKNFEEAISKAALKSFFSAFEIAPDVGPFLAHFAVLRKYAALLQYFAWGGGHVSNVRPDDLIQSTQAAVRDYSNTCDANPEVREVIESLTKSGAKFTKEEITSDFMINMFAGIETTTASLMWMVDSLGRSDAVRSRLAQASHNGDTKMIENFRDECLRFFPPIPFVVRRVAKSLTLEGHRLRPNSQLMISIIGVHRDPAVWDDGNDFRAGRSEFGGGKVRQLGFRPFISGPRSCGGRRIAEMEMNVALEVLLRNYVIKNDAPPAGYDYALAFRPKLTPGLTFTPLKEEVA